MIEPCKPWDARFFALCNLVGSWSEDRNRKVGCVIVGPAREVRSIGYNGLPRGVSAHHPDRHTHENGYKYLWFEHAERNAIYNLARADGGADKCCMYVNSFPCADCTRAIIQAGITELRTFPYNSSDKAFIKHYLVSEAMILESNINLILYSPDDPSIQGIANQ